MKKYVFAFVLFATPAFAQQGGYSVSAKDHQDIMNYLMELPAKYSNPLINKLTSLEQAEAQKRTEAEAAKAAEAAKETTKK